MERYHLATPIWAWTQTSIRKTMRKTQQFMQTAPCFWQPVLMWSSRSQSPPEVKAENHSCTNQRNLCWSFQDNHECQIGSTYWTELCPGPKRLETNTVRTCAAQQWTSIMVSQDASLNKLEFCHPERTWSSSLAFDVSGLWTGANWPRVISRMS